MTITQIILRGHGQAGSGGAWTVEMADRRNFYSERSLYHHGTLMLRWRYGRDGATELIGAGIGWGSVSDQGGMNRAFRALGLPYYYSRAGGAGIIGGDCSDHPGRKMVGFGVRGPGILWFAR